MADTGGRPWRGKAFGVTVESGTPLAGLVAAANGAESKLVEWEPVAEDVVGVDRIPKSEPLVDRRHPDGQLFMSIEQDSELGYRIAAPGYGAHLVAADGSLIRSAVPTDAGDAWQRLFFAQALPLAAALRGLALFHASAVVDEGRAFAFVGLSGTGKTSIAAQLVARGARILTDDVLALEPVEGKVRAHPGPARISVEPAELARLDADGRKRLGRLLDAPTEDGKAQLETSPAEGPAPLGGVFLLSRVPTAGVSVRRDPANRTQALLAAAFLGYLTLPQRLALHLEVCARIAASVPTFAVQIGEGTNAGETAEAMRGSIDRIEAGR
ncbi:MAG TPA: hypothetical protein VLU96_13070 [Gaiellaceae bacterium]|nr:hypothetical protein [Gaiellaceae bacterium]